MKYFVKYYSDEEYREVTVEQFCHAERYAGFRGPGHHANPMQPATSSFSGIGISGYIKYDEHDAIIRSLS